MEFLVWQEKLPAIPSHAYSVREERAYADSLREQGVLERIWRKPGSSTAVVLYRVDDADHLHRVLSALPSFPWITTTVHPLATHPQEATPNEG